MTLLLIFGAAAQHLALTSTTTQVPPGEVDHFRSSSVEESSKQRALSRMIVGCADNVFATYPCAWGGFSSDGYPQVTHIEDLCSRVKSDWSEYIENNFLPPFGDS